MPKGIRKACANCIKARLACDEGRPCQRCIVHQCECIAVARKPRVKKQKLDLEPPSAVVAIDKSNIPSIDSSVEAVTTNWSQSEFAQGSYASFQLDRPGAEEISNFNEFTTSPTLLSPYQLSPPMMQLPSPPSQLPSPVRGGSPAQQQQTSPPLSPVTMWTQFNGGNRMQTAVPQQYTQSILSASAPTLQHVQPVQQVQPVQSAQTFPLVQQLQLTQAQAQAPAQVQSPAQRAAEPVFDATQMLSLLLDEKPTLLQDWQDSQFANYFDGQQFMNYAIDTTFKKNNVTPVAPSPLPQAKNSTPLFPAPIAVFDKQRFQLLDANEAMANFLGHTTVAEMSTGVVTLDDLVDPEAAQLAKNAFQNFVANPSSCYRMGEIKLRNAQSKTVEFNVELTEQLLIFSIKNVFDTGAKALEPVALPAVPVKKDVLPTHHVSTLQQQQCNCKACEFLSPID